MAPTCYMSQKVIIVESKYTVKVKILDLILSYKCVTQARQEAKPTAVGNIW